VVRDARELRADRARRLGDVTAPVGHASESLSPSTFSNRPWAGAAAFNLGSQHHNIATDGSLTAIVLDPCFPGLGTTDLPQPELPAQLPAGVSHHSVSRARTIAGFRWRAKLARFRANEGRSSHKKGETEMNEWAIYPNLDGTDGVDVQADQMTVSDAGVLTFSKSVNGTLTVYKVFSAAVYAYVVAVGPVNSRPMP
jgi:hypothetical protein